MLLMLTLPVAFLYLSGAIAVPRCDILYAVLLSAIWGFYFIHDRLLETRIGPVLEWAGLLLALAALIGFFGGIYWLIFTHS